MGSKCLIFLLVPWIDQYIRISFPLFDEQGIQVPNIVGLVAKEEGSFFELIPEFEFFEQFKGDFLIRDVIGQDSFYQGDSFL